jgi:hypothetical protein
MSINYTTLFTRLGKIVKWVNNWLDYQGGQLFSDSISGGAADDVLDQYEDRRDLVTGLQEDVQAFAGSVAGWESRYKTYADRTLADLQADLNSPSADPATILPLMIIDMVDNNQTVNANAISAATVTPDGGNTGNGQLLVSIQNADGADDERIISETILVKCTSDQFNGGTAGGETFSIVGLPDNGVYSAKTRGNGTGPSITVSDESGGNKLSNGDFETFSVANTPDSWDVGAGVIGTNIFKETVNLHTGSSALKLQSDASATTITLTQSIDALPRTKYGVGIWVRKNGTFGAGVTNLQISIKGTGFSTVDLFNADPTTLTTSYVFKKSGSDGFINIPANVPAGLQLEITWTAANLANAGAQILIDDAAVVEAVDFGHATYALFRGNTDFVVGDKFVVVTANDYGGVFQTFFGRFYDVQLPSDDSAGETLSDTLAT